MKIKWNFNPIGKALENEQIENFIESMKALWDRSKPDRSWSDLFKKIDVALVTNFLLKCLDDLIAFADGLPQATGPDKKATVILAVSQIYDHIIVGALPIWAKPFAGVIRAYVINILIATTIDWIVEKYRSGYWNKMEKSMIEAHWTKLHIQTFGVPLGGHRPKL